jgi:TolA-binding protein
MRKLRWFTTSRIRGLYRSAKPLLRDRDYKAAEQVFRADLKQHPESLRSLLGMAESVRAQGQVKAANAFREEIERARKQADLDGSLDQM